MSDAYTCRHPNCDGHAEARIPRFHADKAILVHPDCITKPILRDADSNADPVRRGALANMSLPEPGDGGVVLPDEVK